MGKKSQKRRAMEEQRQAEFRAQQQAGLAALRDAMNKKPEPTPAPAPAKAVVAPVAAKTAPVRPTVYSAVVVRRGADNAAKPVADRVAPAREAVMHMAARPVALNKTVVAKAEPKKAVMPMTYQSAVSKVMPTARVIIAPQAGTARPAAQTNVKANAANFGNHGGIGGDMARKRKRSLSLFSAIKYVGGLAVVAGLAFGGYIGYSALMDSAPATVDVAAYTPKVVDAKATSFQNEKPIMKVSHSRGYAKRAPIAHIEKRRHSTSSTKWKPSGRTTSHTTYKSHIKYRSNGKYKATSKYHSTSKYKSHTRYKTTSKYKAYPKRLKRARA